MKHLFFAPVFALLFISAGCATTANYTKILDSMIGASEIELVRSWGAPTQTYEAREAKFLTYDFAYSSTNFLFTDYAVTSYPIHINCKTTFEVRNSIIVDYNFVGNNCTAQDPDAINNPNSGPGSGDNK